jgi:hypothetical protein
MRTRMSGRVAGESGRPLPYADSDTVRAAQETPNMEGDYLLISSFASSRFSSG